ncbi:MAG: metal ABC transporter substrate-binding protein [Corynebacterium sp.]|uniref:metal ABC transporter substrate-binding protein n=1 Tax=Corynebacterium TaxID=1716 RepID=UPI0026476A34|nr:MULTISPECIES: metal ABC transporter substrate-binding protein [Corynebacterium]MDN5682991.1 metal ABC transporter substrate-binding protein [Corynebacterium glyciniphilum]MDN5723796.1 metal ABC transporter substrate-binding protein [Corynebacterium sp.]MDN6281367.1 metal ABC transporter substrate-binding protein [Corynebacterium sp.]MDN6304940.1 metal ABC transporter substrate-binding protein [Corynebacterium sp.]MDN6352136.1 metal ABC transporter substrate-binding protein [Corynebacterium 
MIRTIRRTTAATTSILLAGGLVACSSDDARGDTPEVLATFTILADMAQEVAGDTLEVSSLTRPGAEIHGYDPTPGDIRTAAGAEVILSNGLGLENWVDKLTADSDATRVTVTEGIDPVPIEGTDEPNPHAWMSPTLAKVYVDNIVDALSDFRPDDADTFRDNAGAYKTQLDEVQGDLTDGLSHLPENQRALQTCEGAFSYLTRDAGMAESYIWPVNSDAEITPDQIRAAASFVEDNDVPAVFCESTVDPGPKDQLIRDTGARDGGTLYVDSLTEDGGDAPTYLDLIRYDVDTIVEGMRGDR